MNAEKNYTEEVNAGRIRIMAEIEKLQQLDEPTEDENYREPLCVDTRIVKDIVLSTGGPADGFKLFFDENKDLLHGVYYRADWGEYKQSDLSPEEAQTVFDFYMGGELV